MPAMRYCRFKFPEHWCEIPIPAHVGQGKEKNGGAGIMGERIRERAYLLWEADGRPDTDGTDYWIKAENEIVTEAETEAWVERLRTAPKRHVRHDRFSLRKRV